jgi:two-component system sensor histidine kinase KdpD
VLAPAAATLLVGTLPRSLWLPSGVLVYLLSVLAVATAAGRGPGIAASLVSFLAFDFFFTEPRFTFTISDPNEWAALLAYLVVASVASQLAAGQRSRVIEIAAREREARILHDLTDLLAGGPLADALPAVAERLRLELDAEAVAIVIQEDGVHASADAGSAEARAAVREAATGPASVLGEGTPASADRSGMAGRWVRVRPPHRLPGRRPGRGVARVPIRRGEEQIGQLHVLWPPEADLAGGQARLLDTASDQLAVAAERERLRAGAVEAELLRRSSELKSTLLDAVSHDLRTPLASIIAAAGSLRLGDVEWNPEDRQEFLATIEHEANRLNRIVGNLLDLSRIQGGTLVPAKDWHDPGLLLEATVARLMPLAADHRLRVELPGDLPPVLVDPVEIDQVVANLVENAVKYTPHGGDVTVSADVADGELRVSVDDTGPGLPPDVIPRLFEPFYRAGAPRGTRGSGLGLAVARGLVIAHGGRIWAQNREGGGARFSFAIPTPPPPTDAAQ